MVCQSLLIPHMPIGKAAHDFEAVRCKPLSCAWLNRAPSEAVPKPCTARTHSVGAPDPITGSDGVPGPSQICRPSEPLSCVRLELAPAEPPSQMTSSARVN